MRVAYIGADNRVVNNLTSEIRSHGLSIGIDKIGIVPAMPLEVESRRLTDWLGRNYHGEMSWMAREPEKRTDPRLLLPNARSVIVAAVNYYTKYEHVEEASSGKISRYAWGDDYHDIVRGKLDELLQFIRSRAKHAEGKICVDTAPMMDKAWAVRAGIGWLGKHSNVITRDLGSWVFIGELILDIELEYDTDVVEDHCGTCRACIDACPTGAIVEPYVVDSRKCISYATIELRDQALPPEIVPNLDGWLYGCDICQDVCPWNRFETQTHEPRFEPRDGETSLDLERIEEMSHDEYVVRFRGSAIKRAKLSGLKRNAVAIRDSDQD